MENINDRTDAIELMKKVFSFIEGNKLTESSFNKLTTECTNELNNNTLLGLFKENKFDTLQYPRLNFTIGCDKQGNKIQSDIDKLESILDKNISQLTAHVEKSDDPFLKLLYSIVWKQGDLTKLDSIINGIVEKPNKIATGTVFNAFGQHLRDRNNPIIDQHVVRAYLAINATKAPIHNTFILTKILKIESSFIDKNKEKIKHYQEWLKALSESKTNKGNADFFYYADQILFTLGKTIKLKK